MTKEWVRERDLKTSKKHLEYMRNYQQEERVKELRRANSRRRRSDPYIKFDLDVTSSFKTRIRSFLAGIRSPLNRGCPFYHLPYTPRDVVEYIESLFDPTMTWENWGNDEKNGWHMDHIDPKSSAAYNSYDHPNFYFIWRIENLQPLNHSENRSKLCTKEEGGKFMYRNTRKPRKEGIEIMNRIEQGRLSPRYNQLPLFG